MKIDVEGSEKLIFDGAKRILDQDRPVILSEMSQRLLRLVSGIEIDDYFTYLRSKNYEVFEFNDRDELQPFTRWSYGATPHGVNVVLLPTEKLIDVPLK